MSTFIDAAGRVRQHRKMTPEHRAILNAAITAAALHKRIAKHLIELTEHGWTVDSIGRLRPPSDCDTCRGEAQK